MRIVLIGLLTGCTCGAAPTPTEAVARPEDREVVEDPRVAAMERRALPDVHADAIMRYDEDLASHPEDARTWARRGYERLFVVHPDAPAQARRDLEHALTLASSNRACQAELGTRDDQCDRRAEHVRSSNAVLAGAIEMNLGVLDERAGQRDTAQQHYARAHTLDPISTCMPGRPCPP